MKSNDQIERSRLAPALVIGLALFVLGVTLAWSALSLRERIRSQISRRDGEILDAITVMQHLDDRTSGDTLESLADPGEAFQLALKVSRLRNVIGVRLFSAEGKFVNAFPVYITEASLAETDFSQLQHVKPVSHYLPQARLADQEMVAETITTATPLLLVEVPLRADDENRLVGVVQFVMDGGSISRQYAALDRDLALKLSVAFLVGAGILAAGLWLAMRRVQRANRLLAERTEHLLQANRELALAARTSAVGAVASHLIHGLKNPLSGLRNFMHARSADTGRETDTDWQAALSTTQRMQELVNRVVSVLQDRQSEVEYEVLVSELCGMLAKQAKTLAESSGVRFETNITSDESLSNRDADLILLILENLIQNGIEATPSGKTVRLSAACRPDVISFEVCDQGAGLPPGLEPRLFTPCVSSKKGGGGIGLAISKQLAQSLGAKLELAGSGPSGCAFRLVVPCLIPKAVPRAPDPGTLAAAKQP